MLKGKLYKIFINSEHQVEIFMITCVLSSFIFYPNRFAVLASSFIIPLIFIRKKRGLFIASMILLLTFVSQNGLMVIELKSAEKDKFVYRTTKGTLISPQEFKNGEVVIGSFRKQHYAGGETGRFARGYYFLERVKVSFVIPPAEKLLDLRSELSEKMFADSAGRLSLTQALTVGDRSFLSNEMRNDFIYTGLGHMLAVSGLHVGLYAGMIFFAFSLLPMKFRLIPIIASLIILIPLTGFKIPVLRAGLLGIAISTAKFIDYETDLRKLLLFFCGIFILISPPMVSDPSFLLSFSAVYGLVHMRYIKSPSWAIPIMVGLVATAFITPATSVIFGTFNISSVISTIFVVPILSMQIVTFIIYLIFPKISIEPMVMLENIHLKLVSIFADNTEAFFTMFRADIWILLFMIIYLLFCLRYKSLTATFLLLFIPYLPSTPQKGWYFPNMGKSKGFVVVSDKTYIFYKGDSFGFAYKFVPYLSSIGISEADEGTITIYGGENRFIKIKNVSENYGGICVNRVDENCDAVYHTRSHSYKCDDELTHIIYKNRCKTEKTYILNESGDLYIEHKSE